MDDEQIKNLAHLARLDVPAAELTQVAGEIGNIIGFVADIQKVEIAGVQGTAFTRENVFREDSVNPIVPAHDLVEAAALHQDHFVKVPKVIGE